MSSRCPTVEIWPFFFRSLFRRLCSRLASRDMYIFTSSLHTSFVTKFVPYAIIYMFLACRVGRPQVSRCRMDPTGLRPQSSRPNRSEIGMRSITIRPDVRALLDVLKATPMAQLGTFGAVETRALFQQALAAKPAPMHHLSIVRDLECVPGPAARIALRFYDAQAERPSGPILIYFHGGGFVLGDLDSHHDHCLEIARVVDIPVVSVNYRLAPENPGPRRRKTRRPPCAGWLTTPSTS